MSDPILSNYDFSDPAIRDLVDTNHCPEEVTVTYSTAEGRLNTDVSLICAKDRQPWPCPIIQARRAWQAPA